MIMQITIIGCLLIPLSIIFFIFKPMYLYYGMVFLSPFVASSVFNIKNTKTALQPSFWFAFLWLIYLFIKYIIELKNYKFNIKKFLITKVSRLTKVQKKFIVIIFIFWMVCLLSLVMPVILRNKLLIINFANNKVQKLTLRMFNITQFIYLTFFLLILFSVIYEINKKELIINSIKVFLYSNIFVTIWGIYQFISYFLRISYPYYLFNNNICYDQGWNQMIGGIKRVTSVAPEPSMLALYILMSFSIIIWLWIGKIYIINKHLLNIELVLNCFCLILTTSTTAYVGFVALLILLMIYLIFFNKNNLDRKRGFIFIIIFTLTILIIAFICLKLFNINYNELINLIKEETINKNKNSSGVLRNNSRIIGIQMFLKSPILGIGWASIRTYDLLTTLLANIGLSGCVLFACIIYYSIKEDYYLLRKNKNNYIVLALLMSLLMACLTFIISIPDLIFLYFWIMLGLNANLYYIGGGYYEHRN